MHAFGACSWGRVQRRNNVHLYAAAREVTRCDGELQPTNAAAQAAPLSPLLPRNREVSPWAEGIPSSIAGSSRRITRISLSL